MDPVKVIIFVGAFLLLLLLGKKFSTSDDSHAVPYTPQPFMDQSAITTEDEGEQDQQPVAVGADLPFPLRLPELVLRDDGTYNRPEFLNYYFARIDLIAGPPEPNSFCDELFIETRDPKDSNGATYRYLVATPAGLQRHMQSEHLAALYLDEQTIVVAKWDLRLILDSAMQEIIKAYGGWATDADEHAPPDAKTSS